jgi:hypothetical protein
MQRIQYHCYGGPEEMRLETYELPAVCTENSVRVDLVRESLNVNDDSCAVMLHPDAVCLNISLYWLSGAIDRF